MVDKHLELIRIAELPELRVLEEEIIAYVTTTFFCHQCIKIVRKNQLQTARSRLYQIDI